MELRHLRYFVAVAEELHFGRAARRLHISQPPLSAQIKDLEHELGGPLFVRGHHKVELTDSGKALLGRARDLLAQVAAVAAETASIARGERGLVTIGYTTTAAYQLLPRLVRDLRRTNANISLRLLEMASPLQPGALAEQRIDLGIGCLPVRAPDLVARPLVRERMVLAIPREHDLARVSRLRLVDLAGVDQVGLRDSTEPGWATACARELVRGRVRGSVVAEADTKLALLGLVEAGLGVAVISSSLATLGRRGVVYREIDDSRLSLVLGAVHRPDPQPLVRAVLDVAIAAGAAIAI